jgi:hypothetical protein
LEGAKLRTNRPPISKILIALPKPLFAPAGVIWQISGDLIRAGYDVSEVQFFHLLIPLLFSTEPYLVLVSTEILDLEDTTHVDRATLIRAAQAFPKNISIVWDKKSLWQDTDTLNPTNLLVWKDLETNDVTKKILKLLEVNS